MQNIRKEMLSALDIKKPFKVEVEFKDGSWHATLGKLQAVSPSRAGAVATFGKLMSHHELYVIDQTESRRKAVKK